MDDTDIKLCQLLLANSRLSYDELASNLGLSINAVHKRVKILLDLRIIRSFTARLSLTALSAINIWIYGRSQSKHLEESHSRLQKNDSTYWVAYSGGELLYVGAYLRDISELESYVSFVRSQGQMSDPIVAILPSLPGRFSLDELHQLDYQIISALHKDSRKPLADVATELHVSTKTVRNRLDKMIDKRLIDFSMDWYPDASNDIVAIFHVSISANGDRIRVFSSILEKFIPHVLFAVPFSNLPNQLVAFVWTNTMKELEGLRTEIGKINGVESVVSNVLQIGYSSDTWRDRVLLERAKLPAIQ